MSAHPLTADDGATQGLITGYHEPELTGSRQRESAAQGPLYQRPGVAMAGARASREEIERNAPLAGLELVWVDDTVEAFFLQVQGSGRIRLRDGATMRVGYAGDNGHPYHAIGRTLIERGEIDAGALDANAIKDWLRAHPAQAGALMRTNPRYVFFRELPTPAGDDGPPGSLGAPLTPRRSVAVDASRITPGSLLWLSTTDPIDGSALNRAMVAQDTGTAIRGTVRADVFWGPGADAALRAARMKQPGRMWLLVPRH